MQYSSKIIFRDRPSRLFFIAYLLKNRFYIGEVIYRGETHYGEHEAIVDRSLFEAQAACLASHSGSTLARRRVSRLILPTVTGSAAG